MESKFGVVAVINDKAGIALNVVCLADGKVCHFLEAALGDEVGARDLLAGAGLIVAEHICAVTVPIFKTSFGRVRETAFDFG